MRVVIFNDIHTAIKQKGSYVAILVFLGVGFLSGFKFNISVSEELAANASYTVGFMTGLLSLTIILIATILAFSLLFKEGDADFSLIVFSTPIKKKEFAFARFFSFFLFNVFGFLVLLIGYVAGLNSQESVVMNDGFHLWQYAYPFLIFGVINALIVSSILFYVAQRFQSKFLVAITGLLLYVLYMIALMFSNAPFMAQALPQSILVQRISALVDLFGLSGYFFEAKELSVLQRNHEVVPFTGYLFMNRLVLLFLSMGIVYLGVRSFSVLPVFKSNSKKQDKTLIPAACTNLPFTTSPTRFSQKTKWQAIWSFNKIDIIYVFKSIAFLSAAVLMLFYVGVEMFDDIDKGIRLPQHYASSGILAQTINSTFYFLGALVMVYFVNDIYWRSQASGFSLIENTTFYALEKQKGHVGSIALLIFALTAILLLEAIVFQLLFKYPTINIKAYLGVILFNTLPLMLLSGCLLFINILSKHKSLALGISILFFLVFATPIAKTVIENSLFRFLSGYKGTYSDFAGYGIYTKSFLWRLVFGFSIVAVLFLFYNLIKIKKQRIQKGSGILAFVFIAFFSSSIYLKGYIAEEKDVQVTEKVLYEKQYRKYQHIPQPTIKRVTTQIDLYPDKQSYTLKGSFLIRNNHYKPIDSILISVPDDFEIQLLSYQYKSETITIDRPVAELILSKAIEPRDSAKLTFELNYQWLAVNGHQSFNAIIENGSFMRVSRYFPQFGYNEGAEISDIHLREKYGLGETTIIKPLDAPKEKVDDFIDLDMVISTPNNQIAIGTGELQKQWQDAERNFYLYSAESIPFRFALSSASYKLKRAEHNGIEIAVLYHPLHGNNVDRLIENTKLTLDYCTTNFGPYPFHSVTFAEVSSFTQGFAGTAYPGVIFMTENMTFNANIEAGNNQDVVNELAGHEVAHFWWGTNQLAADYREGYAMLTESLAMYTEMMIYKKMYGKESMMERIAIHQQIYNAEKGFNKNTQLLKATGEQAYLSYSKGAIVFVALSELIGENQLNSVLREFLFKHKYPNTKPIATDLLDELLIATDIKFHKKIKSLFE